MYDISLQLPGNVKLGSTDDESLSRKKGKGKQIEDDELIKSEDDTPKTQLVTLDIFAGCGGLSEGLGQSGNLNTRLLSALKLARGHTFRSLLFRRCVFYVIISIGNCRQVCHRPNGQSNTKNLLVKRLSLITQELQCL